jgi:hypothetical protein
MAGSRDDHDAPGDLKDKPAGAAQPESAVRRGDAAWGEQQVISRLRLIVLIARPAVIVLIMFTATGLAHRPGDRRSCRHQWPGTDRSPR